MEINNGEKSTHSFKLKRILLFSLLLIWYCNSSIAQNNATFMNPVLKDGADPYAYYHTDGYYYCLVTRGNRIDIWRTSDITFLREVQPKTVWKRPPSGPNSCSIWAPEIHYIKGKWYIYYSASDIKQDADNTRHVFVLENAAANPLEGKWIDRGAVNTKYNGIDGSVFQFKGKLYFLYSAYVGSHSDIMIAQMTNPWTLKQPEADLAAPMYSWERIGDRSILEGPIFLDGPKDKAFILFSASACWDDNYSLGMLSIKKNGNLLNPSSWKRSSLPVFHKSEKNSVYGPGHNGFTQSPDGKESWIIYHAKDKPNMGCSKRSTRIQKFNWTQNGAPDFGEPLPINVPIAKPSGIK